LLIKTGYGSSKDGTTYGSSGHYSFVANEDMPSIDEETIVFYPNTDIVSQFQEVLASLPPLD
jgi:hypothetical protein